MKLELKIIAIALIIMVGLYFYWQENPLVKVYEPVTTITNSIPKGGDLMK